MTVPPFVPSLYVSVVCFAGFPEKQKISLQRFSLTLTFLSAFALMKCKLQPSTAAFIRKVCQPWMYNSSLACDYGLSLGFQVFFDNHYYFTYPFTHPKKLTAGSKICVKVRLLAHPCMFRRLQQERCCALALQVPYSSDAGMLTMLQLKGAWWGYSELHPQALEDAQATNGKPARSRSVLNWVSWICGCSSRRNLPAWSSVYLGTSTKCY